MKLFPRGFHVAVWGLLTAASFAYAGPPSFSAANPPYFSNARGIVIGGSFEPTGEIALTGGALSNCQGNQSESGDIAGYDCTVQGATATVTSGTSQQVFHFDGKVTIGRAIEVDHGPGWYYQFNGMWEVPSRTLPASTHVSLSLWRYDASPDRLKGSLTLTDYSLVRGVEAALEQ